MSINANYYVIAGFDLTNYKTDKYEDWRWTDEGEQYTCYQRKGHIQLFDDPMMSKHLYFGYVLGAGDEFEFKTVKFDIVEIEGLMLNVLEKLRYLKDVGVIDEELDEYGLTYEVIVFEEDT